MKLIRILAALFILALLAVAYGSIFGVIETEITKAAATATAFEWGLGGFFLVVALLAFAGEWLQFTPVKSTTASVIITVAALALSILSFCGFYAGYY